MEKQLIQLTPEILQYLTDFLVSDKKLSKNDQDLVIRIFKSALKNLLDVYKKQKDFDKFNNQEVLYLFSELLDYSLGELQCFNLLHPNQAITSEADRKSVV